MAAPTANVPVSKHSGISRREDASVFACEHIKWDVPCHIFELTPNNCYNKISAIKNNNKNAFKCRWYLNRDCQGSSYDTQEDQKLNDGNGNFNDSSALGSVATREAASATVNAEIKAHVQRKSIRARGKEVPVDGQWKK
ncbi:hypothetical protein QC761_401335 [Podospora bellae-mahoneyi]|uniref:Uncharacterized protein n=1 Tax=Podospora bellae-mahoneyi TaxID=2093777 RepID=A0ABR0FIH9_9PEZI|nr:hypothetical protein QC761_401335 [Podospora bellae-mahoneyi]